MAELPPQRVLDVVYEAGANATNTYNVQPFRPLYENIVDASTVFNQLRGDALRPTYYHALNGKMPKYLYPFQFAALPARTANSNLYRPTSIYGDETVPRTSTFNALDTEATRKRITTWGHDLSVSVPFSDATFSNAPDILSAMYTDEERMFRPIIPIGTLAPQGQALGPGEQGHARMFREFVLDKFNSEKENVMRGSNMRTANAVIADVLVDARMETPWSSMGRPLDGLAWSHLNRNVPSSVILIPHTTDAETQTTIIQLKRRGAAKGPVYNLVVANGEFVYLPANIVAQYEYRLPRDPRADAIQEQIREDLSKAYTYQSLGDGYRLQRMHVDAVLNPNANIGRMLLQVTHYMSDGAGLRTFPLMDEEHARDYIKAARRWRDMTPSNAAFSSLFVDRMPLFNLKPDGTAIAYRERLPGAPEGVWTAYIPKRVSESACNLLTRYLASLDKPAHSRTSNNTLAWTDLSPYAIETDWPELWKVMVDLAQDMTFFAGVPTTPRNVAQMFHTVYAFIVARNRTEIVPGQELMRLENAPNAPAVFLSTGTRPVSLGWEIEGTVRGQVMQQGDVLIMGPGLHTEKMRVDLYISNVDGYAPSLERPAATGFPPVVVPDLNDTTPVLERYGFMLRFGYTKFESGGTPVKFPIRFTPNQYTFLKAIEGNDPGRTVAAPQSDFMDVSRISNRGGVGLGGGRGVFRPFSGPMQRPQFRPWRGFGRRRNYRRWWGANPWIVYNSLNTWLLLQTLEESRLNALRAAQERQDAEEYWRQVVLSMQDYYRKFGRFPEDMDKNLPPDMAQRLRAAAAASRSPQAPL